MTEAPGSEELTAELLGIAVDVARGAGELLLEWFGGPARGVSTKSSATDPVSDADREAESLILAELRARRPDDGILAEEGGGAGSATGLCWVVDPLDGTVNFLFGHPHWAVSVAVEDDRGGVVGVVHDPNRAETFSAARGRGARLNGEPVSVSRCEDLGQALVATGFAYDPAARERQAATLRRVLPRVRDIRRAGSAALDLAWVACGRFDGYYESVMGHWDRAAGVVLVEEAGGVVTPLPRAGGPDHGVVAGGPLIHGDLESLVGVD